jgi:hypothetical protein
MLIYSASKEDHKQHLRKIFLVLKNNQLFANQKEDRISGTFDILVQG